MISPKFQLIRHAMRRSMRLVIAPFAALALLATPSLAQAPATPPAQAPSPAAPAPSPAAPAPSPAAPAAAPMDKAPADAQPASPLVAPPAQAAPSDAFGEEVTLTAKPVVMVSGAANWDNAFEGLLKSLRTLYAGLDKAGVKATGPALIVYTSTDDTGFSYQAEVPVDGTPKTLPKELKAGQSPDGKTLKFVHRGSYDTMDNTYEAITNHLDDKKLEAQDTFIEEYITDPLKTAEDKLVINVYVPLK